ncbi:S-layer homology domain-containing protein [Propionispira raffinosivorans]|uniref:S-layer homology domain-containing protein n=1 Tax=Propionispira raffinosivorans TaxID=86959 RepID=UPI0003682BEE|nr:S-layer homology domain-containing protein [Propionispira raffinosivorans]
MNKKLSTVIALALSVGITSSAFAAANSFSDVPKDHWSYAAINQLTKDGIIEGNGDGTFAGDRSMSRYEMAVVVARAVDHLQTANPADQALVEKLEKEYASEMKNLDAKYTALDKRVDNVMLSGFVRAKYDSDDSSTGSTFGSENNNKHFYMDFEGKMKVDENWDAHFQSETRKGYTANQDWRPTAKSHSSDDQDGTIQRIWAEGKVGAVGVTLGTKWWGLGYQNVLFGHAADGVMLDYNVTPDWKVSVFNLRPRQSGLTQWIGTTDQNVQDNMNLYGMNFAGKLGHNLETNIAIGANKDKDIYGAGRWGSIDLRTQLVDNLKLTATYSRTNAENNNSSQEYRLDYKGTDLKKVGSFGSYFRYFKLAPYGDISHDDEWGSMPDNVKGWILGVTYVPFTNVQWETFYSKQDQVVGTKDRNLFRTQIDFHF